MTDLAQEGARSMSDLWQRRIFVNCFNKYAERPLLVSLRLRRTHHHNVIRRHDHTVDSSVMGLGF